MRGRIDCGQRSERDCSPGRGCELAQLEAQHLAELERRGHGVRPVPEVRLGREQLDGDPILRQRAQRKSGFERRDAAARDQDARRLHRGGRYGHREPSFACVWGRTMEVISRSAGRCGCGRPWS
jgi:hypothetical protein